MTNGKTQMTKILKPIVYGLLSIVLCFSSSYAAQAKSTVPSPQIDEITAKAEAIDSYTADIQITMLKEPEKVQMSGKIMHKKPDKLNMELSIVGDNPMKQMTISNGDCLWQYIPQANVARKVNIKSALAKGFMQEQGGLHMPFKDIEPESIKFVGRSAVYGHRVLVFEGKPKESLKQQDPERFIKMAVWVSPEDGLARRVAVYDGQDNEVMVQEFTNLKTNIFLRDSLFEFNPPKGTKIEEPFLVK